MKKGHWYGLGAYGLWGLLPFYWKWLHQMPALQLIGHRIVWSFLTLCILITWYRQWSVITSAVKRPRVLGLYLLASLFMSVNWLTFVWAVNAGYIVETSLGYFINPLISILMGVLFLKERFRPWQWVSVGLATLGIVYLTLAHGSLPWIALTLAFSWASYGLIKKMTPLESLEGLTLETAILFLPALLFLVLVEHGGQGPFLQGEMGFDFMLALSGPITTLPLWMFATAVRQTPLSIMGLLQYSSPTLHFLIGTLIYHEPFTKPQVIGFGLVWTALLLLGLEGYLVRRRLGRAKAD